MAARRRVYRSFLLRMWRSADGQERIEIEQIQTAESARLASCAEVRRWIEASQAAALAADQLGGEPVSFCTWATRSSVRNGL
jgi:hypothetical protein